MTNDRSPLQIERGSVLDGLLLRLIKLMGIAILTIVGTVYLTYHHFSQTFALLLLGMYSVILLSQVWRMTKLVS